MHNPTIPSRIVLATDTSARCDRVQGRAAQLAPSWRTAIAQKCGANLTPEAQG